MNQLRVAFEGPRVGEDGVSLDDLRKTLEHVQKAMRLMVGDLAGIRSRTRPPESLRRASGLRLIGTSPGSIVAELVVSRPHSRDSSGEYSQKAIDRIVMWDPGDDRSLPASVADALLQIGSDLSSDIDVVRLCDPISGRYVTIPRKKTRRSVTSETPALLYGWLKAVNWDNRTAQLHRYRDGYVRLRFDASLSDDMRQFATRYVEVRGRGRFNMQGNWTTVRVEQISDTRSWREPFDLDAFLNDPNPKVFDTDKLVTASEPFDADEFNRIIRKGRDVRREGYPE